MTRREMFEMFKSIVTENDMTKYLGDLPVQTVVDKIDCEIAALNRANAYASPKNNAAKEHNRQLKWLILEKFVDFDAPVTFAEFMKANEDTFADEPRNRIVYLLTSLVKEGKLHKSDGESAKVYFL